MDASRALQSGLLTGQRTRLAARTPAYRLGNQRLVVERKIPLHDLVARYGAAPLGIEGDSIFERALAELLQAKLESLWQDLPDAGAVVDLPVVHLGREDASFHPYTQCEPHHPARDPVNLVFYGNATAERVAALFRSLDPPWIDSDIVKGTPLRIPLGAVRQVSWMDAAPRGGDAGFVWSKYSLSPQGCDLNRIHVRLFEGPTNPSNNGWGNWCLGSVHEEEVLHGEFEHAVTEWDGAQKKVERAFQDALQERCHVTEMRLQEPGEVLRGVSHDGMASAIRLD